MTTSTTTGAQVETLTASVGTTGPKPGIQSSEFWATLTGFVILILPALHITAAPQTVREVMGAAAAVVVAAYALGRSIVKAAHQKPPPLPPVENTTIVPTQPDVASLAKAVGEYLARQEARGGTTRRSSR